MTSPVFYRLTLSLLLCTPVFVSGQSLTAPPASSAPDMIDRIFKMREFTPRSALQPQWFDEGASYVLIEPAGAEEQVNVVRYDSATGTRRDILITPAQLTPRGAAAPIEIKDLSWSRDGQRVLIFTNARRVWRTDSRGDYWLLDRRTGQLKKIGGDAPEAALIREVQSRATKVAYVRQNDIYVEDPQRRHHPSHPRRNRSGHQWRLRLGQRGRARSPRLLCLESGRRAHRLLAVRHARRRQLPAHVLPWEGSRDRHSRTLSADRPGRAVANVPYPLADDEFSRGRNRAGRRRERRLAAAAGRCA
jgi:hypothetical protein